MVWSISLSASDISNMKDVSLVGSLKVDILGIVGPAKLLEGDSFEVYIKHQSQKFTAACKVQKGEQIWMNSSLVIHIEGGTEILIKVVQIKGENDAVIGCVSCPTSDFVSENPQICIVPINRLGTMKLRLKILWKELGGVPGSPGSQELVNDKTEVEKGLSSVPLLNYVPAGMEEFGQDVPDTPGEAKGDVFLIRANTIDSISSPRVFNKQPSFPANQVDINLENFIPPPPLTPPPPIPADPVEKVADSWRTEVVVNGDIYARQISGTITLRNVGTQTGHREKKERPDLNVFIPPRPVEHSFSVPNTTEVEKQVRQIPATSPKRDSQTSLPDSEYIQLNTYVESTIIPPPSSFKAHPESLDLKRVPSAKSSPIPSPVTPTNGQVPVPSPRISKGTEREINIYGEKLDNGLISRKEPLRDFETVDGRMTAHDVKDSQIVAVLSTLTDSIGEVMEKVTYSSLGTLNVNCMKLQSMLKRSKGDSVTPSIKSALGFFDFLDGETSHTLKSKSKSKKRTMSRTLPRIYEANYGDSWTTVRPAILHHLKISVDLLKFIGVSSGPMRYREYKAVNLLQEQNDILGMLVRMWLSGSKVTIFKACPDLVNHEALKNLWTVCATEYSLICDSELLKRAFVVLYNNTFKLEEDDDLCQEVCTRVVSRITSQGRMMASDGPVSIYQYFSYFTELARTTYLGELLYLVRHEVKVLDALLSTDDLVVMSVLKDHAEIPVVPSCLRMIAVIMVTGDKSIQEKAELFIKKIPVALRPEACNIFKEFLEDSQELVRAGSCVCLAKLECMESVPQIAYLSRLGKNSEITYAKLAISYLEQKCRWSGFPMAM